MKACRQRIEIRLGTPRLPLMKRVLTKNVRKQDGVLGVQVEKIIEPLKEIPPFPG